MSGVKIVEYYGMDDLLKIVYDYELENISSCIIYAPFFRLSMHQAPTEVFICAENAWTDEFGAKYSQDRKRLLKGPANGVSNYSIRKGTKVICNEAFYLCYGLISVSIPDTVTCVGNSAFSGCSGLTTIHMPDSVLSIGGQAFNCCNNLTSIHLSNNLTSIGNFAFGSCKAISSIKIPGSVIRTGKAIFAGCDNLSAIYIPIGTKNGFEILLSQYKDLLVEQ